MNDPTPTRAEVERHHHWSVTVETSGDHIITLEPECYGGREPSAADEEAIRTAAHHLLSFIGDDTPEALRERAEAAERTIANLHAVEKQTRDKANALFHMNGKLCADYDEACVERDAARHAEATAWNDAIEAAEAAYAQGFAAIRALRRAAPTEGEA